MKEKHIIKIASETQLHVRQIEATAELLEGGATIPFISRYRKEATGSLDEVNVTTIRDRLTQLEDLDKRRESIIGSLEERGLLTDELKEKVDGAETMAVLEDIYLPFKPKRRTRATIAKEKGLEPLAQILYLQTDVDPMMEAEKFLDPEKELNTVEEALSGARDIIAEWANEDQDARAKIRDLFFTRGNVKSKVIAGKEAEGIKYKDYYDWQEPILTTPSHRILAMRRGENEGFLSLKFAPPEEEALYILEQLFVRKNNAASEQVKLAVHDGYKRLLSLNMETEVRLETKQIADEEAIRVFAENLRQLLLSPPLGKKNVLAVDPGFRTGCKVVCLDSQGKLLHNDTIYPTQSENMKKKAETAVVELCKIYRTEIIAVGNGTAGRETETFLRSIEEIKNIPIVMVNESGASIYSASEVAREEFPDYDVTVRGSISIGRRLMDPLAELVKIDPKSIGVGQYQHDVDQKLLKDKLDDVVVSSVNAVGVELNTASKQLLSYVSGIGNRIAKNIVKYRDENGPFKSREELMEVPQLGPKAFEQSAGFLRIRDGKNPLDRSAVHPESYHIVFKMAEDIGCAVTDLMQNEVMQKKIVLKKYVTDTVGLPTLNDIIAELAKPGRDPREQFEAFKFADGVEKMEDLTVGMKLPGIVTNLTAFGAFVDIGVHQDGLLHISQIADKFIKNPADVLKVHQKVNVTVIAIDIERKRISLTMKTTG
jgi:protein Tex